MKRKYDEISNELTHWEPYQYYNKPEKENEVYISIYSIKIEIT